MSRKNKPSLHRVGRAYFFAFFALFTIYQIPVKKNHFKVLVLTIFSYLCLPKKRGNKVLPVFFEKQFFTIMPK